MALLPMRVLLDHAAENSYGVAAFNGNNMEQVQAIMGAAVETDSPVIIQASRGVFQCQPEAFDPRQYLAPARAAMKAVCAARMIAFGQAGNASRIGCR